LIDIAAQYYLKENTLLILVVSGSTGVVKKGTATSVVIELNGCSIEAYTSNHLDAQGLK
jgi:hypothetical protein